MLSQDRRHLLVTPALALLSPLRRTLTHPAQPHTHLHTLSYRPQVCHGGRIDRYSHSKNNEYTLAQGPPHVLYGGGRQGPPPVIHLVRQAHVLYHKAHAWATSYFLRQSSGATSYLLPQDSGPTLSHLPQAQAHLISSSTSSGAHLICSSTRLRGELISSSISNPLR